MLRVDGLVKRLGDRHVLNGIALSVLEGEVFGLLGANGAGKSTTVNVIAGLLTPDAGDVTIGDAPVTQTHRSRLGVAPQELAIYPTLTCEENLLFFAALYGLRGSRLRSRVHEAISQMELSTYRNARAETLSGGWKRRLNLAIALVHRPAVVLLDEPTAGLDPEARRLVWRQIQSLRGERTAVLLTTHALDEVEALCDRVAVLVRGRIAALGTLDQLRRLVPAAEVAVIGCEDDRPLRARAQSLGLAARDYDGRPTLLLPQRTTVAALAAQLRDLGVQSITLRPVSLSDVYWEVCAQPSTTTTPSEPRPVVISSEHRPLQHPELPHDERQTCRQVLDRLTDR